MSIDMMLNEPMEVTRRDMVCSLRFGDILSAKLLFSYPIARRSGSICLRSFSESLPELESLPPGPEYANLETVIRDTAGIMYLGEIHGRFAPSVLLF